MIIELEEVALREQGFTVEGDEFRVLYIPVFGKVEAYSMTGHRQGWKKFDHRAPIVTLASGRATTLGRAKASFHHFKSHLASQGDQTWLYFEKKLREYADVDEHGDGLAEVWADVVLVKGFWVFENGVLVPAPSEEVSHDRREHSTLVPRDGDSGDVD